MTLSTGTRLGPYEILAPLGAGGMGEVYRARDERLKRDVAIKVLPAELAADADRRMRFEREARAASGLSHPNILTIYDIGSADSMIYIAMELIDGGTLKDLVASGPLPTKKLLEIGVQIADGLAEAHAAGIVHRDLKPQNVMVSKHGYVKILDFGLAKLVTPEERELSVAQTAVDATRPGMVMGTVGYMSPEQAAGRPIDFRSDQFSFGSILYELATGKRAFERSTTAETLTAIIREEPAPVAQLNPKVPAPVRWLVERCLTKDPEDRFGTTKDLARDLASIRDHLSEAPGEVTGQFAAPAKPRPRVWPILLGAALLAAVGVGAFAAGKRLGGAPPPSFRQLTFQRGEIYSARFAPDGQTVLYAAAWEGRPVEILVGRLESPESRPFGLKGADVFAISPSGEIAVSIGRRYGGPFIRTGTLARIGITGGGTPREVQEDVHWGDWSPDGANLAIVRDAGARNRLEYPIGKVIYETDGWVSNPRVSRGGDVVAFLDHPARGDDGGSVAIVDRAGKKKTLTRDFATEGGLAWSPNGNEIWFTAAEVGGNRALYAVTPSGAMRIVTRVTGNLTLHDVSRDGRVLIAHDTLRSGILVLSPGDQKERDLSWLDWSAVQDLSTDGKSLLFSESGEGGGQGYSTYLRSMDGSPPVRLGEGSAQSLSPDGKWAIAILHPGSDRQAVLLPTGAGEPKPLTSEGLVVADAQWVPDGKHVLLTASEPGHGNRLYLIAAEGGKVKPLTPLGYRAFARTLSPDGKWVTVTGPDRKAYLYPLEGGEPAPIPGLNETEIPVGWTSDGRFLYVTRPGEYPARVYRLEVSTGKRELWKELTPPDPAGIFGIRAPRVASDGKSYVYSYNRILSDLFLADGVK
ncbi:MAG TPA: protein kinase [Thermoanaerobaculia bacterium]|jgi:Tol biopolymer transport system component